MKGELSANGRGFSASDGQGLRERQVMLARDRRSPTALLGEVARLARSADMDAHVAMAHVLLLLEQELGLERAAFGVVDRASRVLSLDCARGVTPEHQARARYAPGEGVIGQVLESGQPAIVPNIREEPRFLDRARARAHVDLDAYALLCAPIVEEGAVVGTIGGDLERVRQAAIGSTMEILKLVGALALPLVQERRASRSGQGGFDAAPAMDEGTDVLMRDFMVGSSTGIRAVFGLITKVAPSRAPVLIRGEAGTGKELVARTLHALSDRADKPMVVVSCASLPETLVESELFGHVKHSSTGGHTARRGRLEVAHGGTLFLDEVADLSPSIQVKLLRVIQTGELCRVGDGETIRVDVRVMAATQVDLQRAVQVGRFRQDLLYRLDVLPLEVPPLRERRDDIPALAAHFLLRSAAAQSKRVHRFSDPAMELLCRHDWPGNVRELETSVSRAVQLAHYGVVRQHHLPSTLQRGVEGGGPRSLRALTDAFERDLLVDALRRAGGNRSAAARILRTTPRVLSYRLRRLGV